MVCFMKIVAFIFFLSATTSTSQASQTAGNRTSTSNTSLSVIFSYLSENAKYYSSLSAQDSTNTSLVEDYLSESYLNAREQLLGIQRSSGGKKLFPKLRCVVYCLKNFETKKFVVKQCAPSKRPLICFICRNVKRCNNTSAFK